MSTAAQRKASRLNGSRGRGPRNPESLERTRWNALRTGARAKTLILPGESAEDFAIEHQISIDDFQPRNSTEHDLVFDIVRARWMYERVSRAHTEHLKAKIEAAALDDELGVEADLTMLWDMSGQHQLYGLTSAAVERPPAPELGKDAEANKPPALVRKLEGSARGCRALLDTW